MHIEQRDLFSGLSKDFVDEVMNISEKKTFKRGDVVYREGDQANNFYILQKGRVTLTVGKAGQLVYTLNHPGETFGTSSLIGIDNYPVTAACMEETNLLQVTKEKFDELTEKDPANGLVMIRHVASMLGDRLFQSYKIISSSSSGVPHDSYGSGQIVEPNSPV
jgi:CRP-like cAMP-binding protein